MDLPSSSIHARIEHLAVYVICDDARLREVVRKLSDQLGDA